MCNMFQSLKYRYFDIIINILTSLNGQSHWAYGEFNRTRKTLGMKRNLWLNGVKRGNIYEIIRRTRTHTRLHACDLS